MKPNIPFIYEANFWIICISSATSNDLDCFLAMSAIYLFEVDLGRQHQPVSCLLRYHEFLRI